MVGTQNCYLKMLFNECSVKTPELSEMLEWKKSIHTVLIVHVAFENQYSGKFILKCFWWWDDV